MQLYPTNEEGGAVEAVKPEITPDLNLSDDPIKVGKVLDVKLNMFVSCPTGFTEYIRLAARSTLGLAYIQ